MTQSLASSIQRHKLQEVMSSCLPGWKVGESPVHVVRRLPVNLRVWMVYVALHSDYLERNIPRPSRELDQ